MLLKSPEVYSLATYEKSIITVQLMQTSKNLDHFL
jgi:hypothetical protein